MAVDLLTKPTLAVDFDWVLHAGTGIAPEGGSIVGDPPVPGAIEWLHQVGQAFQIVVFSVSANSDESKTQIVNWLTEAGFSGVPYQVTDVKPDAHAYVDDRGWRFDGPGSFPSVTDLAAFEPWWKRDAAPGAKLNAKALAVAARAAEPVVTPDMADAVGGNGGQLVGAQNRLKDEADLAAKVEARATGQNVPNSDAAASIHDALRYAATFPPETYTQGVHGALDGLEAAGYQTDRVRNYWAPQSPPGTQQPLGTYKGINAVMRAPGGTPFEVQFHTPDSWQTNADQNWPLYAQLRDGNLDDDAKARAVEQMRGNLADVQTPAGASTFERARLVPKPDVVPPLTADAVADDDPFLRDLTEAMMKPLDPEDAAGPALMTVFRVPKEYADPIRVVAAASVDDLVPPPDIDEHNRIVVAGQDRAFNELEPKLAKLLEPVLRQAGQDAAKKFTALTTKSMTAAAYRSADALRLSAMGGMARVGILHNLVLTAAAPSPNSTMIALKPTPEQAAALAWKYGEDAQHLHVTLMSLGGTSGDLNRIAEAVGAVAANHAPLSGQVSGHGQFGPDGHAIDILLPDVPGLVELRCAVADALVDADISYARDHGFEAHMTVSFQRNGSFPPGVHYRKATGRGGEGAECGTCSFFEPQGYCRMFSAAASWHMVCDEWTDDHVEMTAVGAPLDFSAILVVRGDTEVVELPLVGAPPLTAAADAILGPPVTRQVQSVAETQAQLTAQEQAAQQAQEALASAMDELHNAQHALDVAMQRKDPELIATAEHRLTVAREDVRRALQGVPKKEPDGNQPGDTGIPVAPGAPVTPPATPITAPLQTPTTIGGQLQPPTDIPSALQQSAQGKAQDIFTNVPGLPDQSSDGGVNKGGTLQEIEEGLQEAGYIAQPDIEHIETVQATPPEWNPPAGDELLNVDELANQVRGVTDPVRQAVIQTVGEPIVNSVGLQWDDANPFSAKVLAQSASQVVGISDTTQANVMQIIQQAHDNGWTIPQTADAIQQGMSDATPARATLIARTELAGAVNGGSLAATQIVQSATGQAYAKVWHTAPGAPHPRHELYPGLDGETVDTLDGLFDVGDAQLAYPGDPDGPPGEVCNCRCTLTYQEATAPPQSTTAPDGDQAAQDATGPTVAADLPAAPPPEPVAAVKPKDPILGITPFRAGEDNPLGFYDSAKAQQFEADLKTEAAADNLTITSADHVTGIWKGDTEPSYSVHVLGDQTDVQRFSETMRARYNQDSVMVFTPEEDLPPGLDVNAVQYRIMGLPGKASNRAYTAYVTGKVQSVGLDGGTFFGRQLELVGTQDDAAAVSDLADQLGGEWTVRKGHVDWIERPVVSTEGQVTGVLKAPDPATELGDSGTTGVSGLPLTVSQQQHQQAKAVLTTGLPNPDLGSPGARSFAKAEIADDIAARLQNNQAWQDATQAAEATATIPIADVKPGDVISTYSGGTVKVNTVTGLGNVWTRESGHSATIGRTFRLVHPEDDVGPGVTEDTTFKVTSYLNPEGGGLSIRAEVVDPGGGLVKAGDPIFISGSTPIQLYADQPTVEMEGVYVKPPPGYHTGDTWSHTYAQSTERTDRMTAGNAWPMPTGVGGAADTSASAKAVAGLVDTWSFTAADANPWALAVQRAAHEEFGIDDSAVAFLEQRDPAAWRDADALYAEKGPALRAFVRAQYDNTQAMLAVRGVHDLTLYRGFGLSDLGEADRAAIPFGGHADKIRLQPASSFSASFDQASNFTGGDSAVLAAQVPASRILGTARSGVGCLGEEEFVVLGQPEDAPVDQAFVNRFDGWSDKPTSVNNFWASGTLPPSGWSAVTDGTKVGDLNVGDQVANVNPDSQHPSSIYEVTGPVKNGDVPMNIIKNGQVTATTAMSADYVAPFVKKAGPEVALPSVAPTPATLEDNIAKLKDLLEPAPAASTAWTVGEVVVPTQLNVGDTFKGSGYNEIYKYLGKNDAGLPMGEVIDPQGAALKVGAVTTFDKSALFYRADGVPSDAKPPKPSAWLLGGDVNEPADGWKGTLVSVGNKDWLDAMKNAPHGGFDAKGAVFTVTSSKPDATGHVYATVIDPGKSTLNVGETYLIPSTGLSYVHKK